MAGGKLTPRQKMINLMYLIFIAMMAMNVDREVLRSFEGVNNALITSTQLNNENNINFYNVIESKKGDGSDYARIAIKAKEVKNKSDKVYQTIETLKQSLIGETKYKFEEGEESDYNSLQNADVVNKVFFSNEKITIEAKNMLKDIESFRDFMINDTKDSKTVERVKKLFDTSDKVVEKGQGKKSWMQNMFYDQPMIAALTNLSRLQSNIRTEEGNKIRDLLTDKMLKEVQVKKFMPIVNTPKYVKAGEAFTVNVAFGAYDNTLAGAVVLNGQNVPLIDGKASLKMGASGSGIQHLKGSITYVLDGQNITVPFDETYEVVAETLKNLPTGGVVMADKMNIVYRGVSNPISASVTGVDASTIRLSASSGSLTKKDKGWSYKPSTGKEVVFTVSGVTSMGKTVSSSFPYRIKNIPKPEGQIRGQNMVTMPASSIVNQKVTAAIPDFEFPVTFTVNSFKVKVPGLPTKVVSGSSLKAAGDIFSRLRSGDQVAVFDINVTANGIDTKSNVSPIVINVQ